MVAAPRQTAASDGFTLIELLVVFAIMGLMLMLASPRLQTIVPGFEAQSAARELAAALRETRSRALQDGDPAILTLDLDARRYAVARAGASGESALPADIDLDIVTAAGDVSQRDRRASFRFFPDGSATGGTITLSRGGTAYRIEVDWLTGRVRIGDGEDAR